MEEDDDSKEVCNFVETLREGSHLVFGAPSFGFWRQITSSSADADKPARRVYGSVKVTKHSTIRYVRYSFQLCNSNFVFKTRRFFYDIRLQKCRDLENRVRGPSRSLEMTPLDRAHNYDFLLTFYSNYGSISCRMFPFIFECLLYFSLFRSMCTIL